MALHCNLPIKGFFKVYSGNVDEVAMFKSKAPRFYKVCVFELTLAKKQLIKIGAKNFQVLVGLK